MLLILEGKMAEIISIDYSGNKNSPTEAEIASLQAETRDHVREQSLQASGNLVYVHLG